MATTNYAGLSQRTVTHAEAKMLAHAEPIIVLSKYGMVKPLPKNKADNITFRRPIPFPSVHGSPLTEGVSPTPRAMQYEDVQVTLGQYGDVVEITDKVADLAEDPVLNDSSMLCGEQAAETMEMVTYGAVIGGTNVFFSNGTARNQVNTEHTLSLQRKITRALKAARGKPVTSMVASSVKYGTEQIAPAYLAFGHTDLENSIRELPGFVPCEKYGNMKPLPYEIGKCEDTRYILSPLFVPFADAGGAKGNMISTTGTSADVYPLVFIAKEAFGIVPLKGRGAITPHVVQPEPSHSQPLGQKGFVGWKAYFAAKVLNETWLVRAEVAADALA